MSNVQPYQNMTPEIKEAFKPEVLDVIRNSVAPTANDHEFMLFAHKAASYGLDPFKNEIFFIKYGNTARIQFAAEAYLSKAREKEGFQPPDTQMVHENDEFKVEKDKETGELKVVQHDIGFPRGKIIGAYSIAHRDGHRPVTVIMDITEIEHMFTGQNKDNWNKWTADMFGKHVQQRALKRQYGLEFDDVDLQAMQGGQQEETKRERKDITNDVNSYDEPQTESQAPPEQKDEKKESTEEKKQRLRNRVGELFKQVGVNTDEEMAEYIQKNAKVEPGKKPTIAQLENLIKVLEMHADSLEDANDDDLPE